MPAVASVLAFARALSHTNASFKHLLRSPAPPPRRSPPRQANSGIGTRLLLNAALSAAFPVAPHAADARALTLSAPAVAAVAERGGGGGLSAGEDAASSASASASAAAPAAAGPRSFLLRFPRAEHAAQMLEAILACRGVACRRGVAGEARRGVAAWRGERN